jgi:alpha-glucosidase (family GH31 glycosyl hydrolase)
LQSAFARVILGGVLHQMRSFLGHRFRFALLALAIGLLTSPSAGAADWESDAAELLPVAGLKKGHWWVLGPFEWAQKGRQFWGDRPLAPDNAHDLQAAYTNAQGLVKWREVPEWDQDGKLCDVAAKLGMDNSKRCLAACLYRQIQAPTNAEAILYLGFNDGCVLRVNGEVVFERFFYRSTSARQEAIPVKLRAGANDFLLKLVDKDNTGGASFIFQLEPRLEPRLHAQALEALIAQYAEDQPHVRDAQRQLVHLYRQCHELAKADALWEELQRAVPPADPSALAGYGATRPGGVGQVLRGRLESGRAVFETTRGLLYLGFWRDRVARFTFVPYGTPWPYPPTHRPLPVEFDRRNEAKPAALREEGDRFLVSGKRMNIAVPKNGAALVFSDGTRERWMELGHQLESKPPTSKSKGLPGSFEHLVFQLDTREGVFGLGHRYDAFNRRGRVNAIGNCDRGFGESHFTLPYFVTQGHDALFINSFGEGDISVDRPEAPNMAVCRLEEKVIDGFYFRGEPKELVRQWVDLTGHTVMPPDWTLGVWMSRNSYHDENTVLEVARRLRALQIPSHVLVLEAWREDGPDWMSWNPARWKNHEAMCRRLHEMGFKVVLWTMQFHMFNNTLPQPYEKEALAKDYFVMDRGQPWGYDPRAKQSACLVDFFNPAACDWWQRQYRPLFDPVTGIDGLKTDIGENNAGTVLPGWTNINNVYALGYLKCAWEMTRKLTGHGMVFARTGTVGTQRYPLLWAGDHSTWFQGMQEAYHAMMGAGLAGFAWNSFDVGGLYGDLDKETYVRMAQMGAFCPVMQAHGQGKREPYDLGDFHEEAVDIFNRYANWHMVLKPYRIAAGQEACRTGVPIMRPLWMEFPNDPECYEAEYQYFFGPDILVAPIMSCDHQRKVYLPRGDWIDWWTGQRLTGGGSRQVEAPLEQMPLFIRPGSKVLKFAPAARASRR